MVNLLMKKILLKILITKPILDYIIYIQDQILVFLLDKIKSLKIFLYREFLYLETLNKKILLVLIFSTLLIPSALAHHLEGLNDGAPAIYSINPQFITQGQVTTAVVTGLNLNSTFIGVTGGDVFAVVLKQDVHGDSLTVQFAVQPTAIGEKKFFVKNGNGQETSFPIQVIPSGAPSIESVDPASGNPGSTLLVRI